jgi:hypothetical protein
VSASFARTASFLATGTYNITASWALSSSQALTASYAETTPGPKIYVSTTEPVSPNPNDIWIKYRKLQCLCNSCWNYII